MIDHNKYQLSTAGADATFLGTTQTLSAYSSWQENQVGAVVQCSCIEQSKTYIEFKPTFNPRTSCEYREVDDFHHTTYSQRDIQNSDAKGYFITASAIDEFSRTFPGSTLYENQLAVAHAAFSLFILGKKFSVVVSSTEVELIDFCKQRNWTYQII